MCETPKLQRAAVPRGNHATREATEAVKGIGDGSIRSTGLKVLSDTRRSFKLQDICVMHAGRVREAGYWEMAYDDKLC
jgi:hypothetical protein